MVQRPREWGGGEGRNGTGEWRATVGEGEKEGSVNSIFFLLGTASS